MRTSAQCFGQRAKRSGNTARTRDGSCRASSFLFPCGSLHVRHGEGSSDFSGVASGCSFFTATGYAVGAGWFFLLGFTAVAGCVQARTVQAAIEAERTRRFMEAGIVREADGRPHIQGITPTSGITAEFCAIAAYAKISCTTRDFSTPVSR